MKDRIKASIENPEKLEKLYQDDKDEFRKCFLEISDEYNSELVRFWQIRFAQETEVQKQNFQIKDIIAIIILTIVTGLLVKIPDFLPQIDVDFFYPRNLAIIIFNGVILFTFWQKKIFDRNKILLYAFIIIVLTLYLNFLPNLQSDSIILSFIHTPLFLWCLFGLAFVSFDYKDTKKRFEFIRFNGELLIMTGLIVIAGGLLIGITFQLFSVLEINIENFLQKYIVIFGGVAAPIVSLYLIRFYPNLTNKIGPVIAKVFTPIVLSTLFIYLIFMFFSNINFLEDRELLIIFNVLLFIVMAIIVFSLSELDKTKEKNINVLVLFGLAVLAIVINSIALITIITRVIEGLTPNRTVVLMSNILIFINLILVAKDLFRSYHQIRILESVEKTVAKYLTIYWFYTILVIFILPFVFRMR